MNLRGDRGMVGLRLLVRVHQPDYMPWVKSAGMRVVIHGQGTNGFPDSFGFDAAPGFVTSFGIKYLEQNRLPAPYGTCLKGEGDNKNYFTGGYTVEGCVRSCIQQQLFKVCECYDPTLANFTDVKTLKDMTPQESCSNQPTANGLKAKSI